MKKLIALFAVLVMLLSLAACGGKAETGAAGSTAGEGKAEITSNTANDPQPAAESQDAADGGDDAEATSVTAQIYRIQACGCYTYGLKPDGTLIVSAEVTGGENVVDTFGEFASWSGIKNFSVNDEAVAVVLEDGTVRQCGGLKDQFEYADFSQVPNWRDIVQVSIGKNYLIGLKSDGSVEMAGYALTEYIDDTTGYVQVECGCYPFGVKQDGTVTLWDGPWDDPVEEVASWTDIVSVSNTFYHVVGLKSDGTVVACGDNDCGQCDVGGWTDIVAVSAGMNFTLGLKSDGTVVACGNNDDGQCDVGGWSNIVEIDAGYYHSTGITADGSVVATGANYMGQCNVRGWTL